LVGRFNRKYHRFGEMKQSRSPNLNIFGRNRFPEIELKFHEADPFEGMQHEEKDAGLHCKSPRSTKVHRQSDALTSISPAQLLSFLKSRSAGDPKERDSPLLLRISDLKEKEPPVWVDIQGTHDEMGDFARAFDLHPLTLEDCTVADTREKIEMRNNYIFLVIHDISLPGEKGINLNMVIYPDLLLTIHEKPIHSIYDVAKKLEYCDNTEIPSIEFVVYVILSSVISFYGARMDHLRHASDELDGRVLASTEVHASETPDLLGGLGAVIKRCAHLRASISVKKDLFESLSRYDIFSSKGKLYIKGALNQVLKMDLQISLLQDTLDDIHELCMAKISVQLAVASNDVGAVSRQFAIITALFLPANLLAGMMGMNVNLPKLAVPGHTNFTPFISIIFVMLGLAIMQVIFYRGRKWF